ncbi:MAG: GNAT family N-acetyltransferase [Lachnospiraceae bacterium]|nr:GNAT family N-acetyltransferase [Lachnospiraceae bacterium]
MDSVEYRSLTKNEVTVQLFGCFIRRQIVTKCWRKEDGKWVIKDAPFIDDWSPEDYQFLVECLKKTIEKGGLVLGAFSQGELKGFTSVEAEPLGKEKQYLDLTSLHVSQDMRRKGIGKALFLKAAAWAKGKGAKKLYISAHSAAETQSFYRGLGCVDAEEINREHAEREPFDCQMEYLC